jgi:hypothetical protein
VRKIVALGAVAAASLVLSGCGQPSLGSAGAGTAGGAIFSGAVWTPAATATVAATAVSRADFGDMSGWVAEPGNFGPIGAAASTDALAHAPGSGARRHRLGGPNGASHCLHLRWQQRRYGDSQTLV